MTNRQVVIWNLVAFGCIHFVFEVLINMNNPIKSAAGASVVMQYLISWWIIQGKIKDKSKTDLIRYTWLVSICVFAVRLVLGLIVFAFLFR